MKEKLRGVAGGLLAALATLSACTHEEAVPSPPVTAVPSSASATATNGVMMQGFYWNVPTSTAAGSWWQNLGSKAAELSAAGITAMWLPPAYKGSGALDVGYGVYDRYDLGEFNQKGTVATRYGTLAQLQTCISALHGQGMQVYEDMVMNHLTSADAQEQFNLGGTAYNVWTSFTYPGRGNAYSNFQWHYNNFNATQQAPNNGWYQWHAYDFQPYSNGEAYDNLLGSEIRYSDANQATETIRWGNWITTKLSLDGYRLDATKHMLTSFVNQWLDNVKGPTRFAVSEAWFGSLTDLNNYAASTGGRTSFFDVPLHYTFMNLSNGNGTWDMRGLQFAGFTEANGPLSVSFVDNHDTDEPGGALYSPVANFKMLAYSYILTREKGYPCVFYRDFYEYGLGAQIKQLIQIRKAHGFGAGVEYPSANDANMYLYSRTGDASHTGLLEILNDGSAAAAKGVTTPFKNATLTDLTGNNTGTVTTDANGFGTFRVGARGYAVWVPGSGGTTPPAPGTTAVTFNISYSNTVYGQDLYLVGNTGPLGAWNPTSALKMGAPAWPAWTVTVNLPTGTPVLYKHIRKDAAGNVLWEADPNNSFTPTGTTMTRNDTWH